MRRGGRVSLITRYVDIWNRKGLVLWAWSFLRAMSQCGLHAGGYGDMVKREAIREVWHSTGSSRTVLMVRGKTKGVEIDHGWWRIGVHSMTAGGGTIWTEGGISQ